MSKGVGQKKQEDYGEMFLQAIVAYCTQHDVPMDAAVTPSLTPPPARQEKHVPNANAIAAFPLFEEGLSLDKVAERLGPRPIDHGRIPSGLLAIPEDHRRQPLGRRTAVRTSRSRLR